MARTKRKTVGQKTRFDVFKRDRFACQYCGGTPPAVVLTVDHVVAVANGGTNSIDNLVSACWDCNGGKGARPLDQLAPSQMERLAEQRERIAQARAYNEFMLELHTEQDVVIGRLGRAWYNIIGPCLDRYECGDSRKRTLRTFLNDLPELAIRDSMELAIERIPPEHRSMDDQTWKYFCGICWKKIRRARGEDV